MLSADAWHTMREEALDLVFPSWCAGCDEPGRTLCDDCAARLRPLPISRTLESGLLVPGFLVPGFLVHSGVHFEGVAARVLRALKEDGRTPLARPLGTALGGALEAALAVTGIRADEVAVVPVPSSRSALRRRGFAPAELLVRRAGASPARMLRLVRATADQRGLDRQARAANLAGAFVASRRAAGTPVVIVDDVVTTGATLREASRALVAAGATVIGAATVAATPTRGRSDDPPHSHGAGA